MNKQTEEDIIKVLLSFYNIPGQYFIGALILFAFWNSMKDITGWATWFLIFGIFFLFLEIITIIMAGKRLLVKLERNLNKIFR